MRVDAFLREAVFFFACEPADFARVLFARAEDFAVVLERALLFDLVDFFVAFVPALLFRFDAEAVAFGFLLVAVAFFPAPVDVLFFLRAEPVPLRV